MGGGKKNEVKETAAERANAEVALRRYGRYLNAYRPTEAKAFADVAGDASAQHLERTAAARVNADSAQVLDHQRLPAGVDPSRGAAFGAVNSPSRAAIVADAATKAAGLGRKQKIAGLQAAVNIGAGQADEAQLAFGDLAGGALNESINKQVADFNRRNSNAGALMSLAGAGVSAYTRPAPGGTTYSGPLSPSYKYGQPASGGYQVPYKPTF